MHEAWAKPRTAGKLRLFIEAGDTMTILQIVGQLFAVLIAIAIGAGPASAEAQVPPLMCRLDPRAAAMPGFTAAEVVDKPAPRYPSDALDDWSEGWVLLEYEISETGVVRGMRAVDAFGSKDFVASAMRAVSRWRYKPATRNTVPVEQFLAQSSVLYLFTDSRPEAEHGEFVTKYNRARRHIRDNEFDRAIQTLEKALKGRLNLYEAAMGSFALALAYAGKADWPHAVYHIRHATNDLDYLEKQLRVPALALQVELEARDGSLLEAMCAFKKLQSADPARAASDDSVTKMNARIEAAVTSPSPLMVDARLIKHPLFDEPAVWRHRLLRSKFSFAEIKGDVTSFRLACVGTAHEAPVDAETLWDVPAKAGPCILRVDGAPDASFKLVETW